MNATFEILDNHTQFNRTQSCGVEWRPISTTYTVNLDALRESIASLTPSNEELRKFATDNKPDPSWWDEDDPFVSGA